MATEVSNIDDLLLGGTSPSIPQTPESKPEDTDGYETPDGAYGDIESSQEDVRELSRPEESDSEEPEQNDQYVDEYGTEKPKPRTYTEEEHKEILNKEIRRRVGEKKELARQQLEQQQIQHQAIPTNYENNTDDDQGWKNELEGFVEKTFSKLQQKKVQEQQRAQDDQIQADFEAKFDQSMARFPDFEQVVGSQTISNPMSYALRGMSDPAAFIYAAIKRHPAELQRIGNLPDQYAQMVEMGKLEERMRKTSAASKAPKPVSRSRDDGGMPSKGKSSEPTIEDMIASSDAKRKAQLMAKRGR